MHLPRAKATECLVDWTYTFKPVTGLLELSLNEQAAESSNHSEFVSKVLSEALATLAGATVDIEQVKSLCVGDRQFLMHQLAATIDDSPLWLTAKCKQCSELFDLSIRHSDLPVKPAGKDFPEVILQTQQGPIKVRVPTGKDQEIIAHIDDDDRALEQLLHCLITPLSTADKKQQYSAETIAEIENAVEAMSPEIATEILAQCPECHVQTKIPVSGFNNFGSGLGDLYREIHQLAMHYHWGEREILSLPRNRRLSYLGLIDQSREMFSLATGMV